jgi:hypothetical protein
MAEGVESGCWHDCGFPEGEIPTWRAVALIDAGESSGDFVLARVAAAWRVAGFDVDAAEKWTHTLSGTCDWTRYPHEARRWRAAGFNVDRASTWTNGEVAPGLSLDEAVGFRDAGWHPFHVWCLTRLLERRRDGRYVDPIGNWTDIPIGHALGCARAGISSNEARQLVDCEPVLLERILRALFDPRRPISKFTSMTFNHHVGSAFYDTPDGELPFWGERLWDLLDDDNEVARVRGEPEPYGMVRGAWPRGAGAAIEHTG